MIVFEVYLLKIIRLHKKYDLFFSSIDSHSLFFKVLQVIDIVQKWHRQKRYFGFASDCY